MDENMKRLLFTLAAALTVCGAASAQRLQVGFRGGINTTDYRFSPVVIDGTRFVTGSSRVGYEAGVVRILFLIRPRHTTTERGTVMVSFYMFRS